MDDDAGRMASYYGRWWR